MLSRMDVESLCSTRMWTVSVRFCLSSGICIQLSRHVCLDAYYIYIYIYDMYIYIHMGDRWHNYKYIATNSLLRMHSTMRGQPRLQTWSFFARTTATTAAFGIARTNASFSSTCAGYTRTTATWKHYFFSARTTAADAYKCQLSRTTAVFQAIILYVGEYIMQQDVWHHNSTAA